jgi:murein DD-endopeptidase MepM/ murein hydrolase activator NlpD
MTTFDGFDSPVGTLAERADARVWPGNWVDVNPIGTKYALGHHTGSDLNLPGDGDAHAGVYAVAAGKVIYAQNAPGSWGNLIVIEHNTPEGVVFSRYGHVESMRVQQDQEVTRGQQICQVGNAFGRWAFHLHFDISTHPTRLREEPYDWSAWSLEQVRSIYTDPRAYIDNHRAKPVPDNALWVVAPAGLNLRAVPAGTILKTVPFGTPVVTGMIWVEGAILWAEATLPTGEIGWLAVREGSDLYLSRERPK